MQNHQYFCKFQLIPGLNSFARILVILKAQSNRKLAYKFSALSSSLTRSDDFFGQLRTPLHSVTQTFTIDQKNHILAFFKIFRVFLLQILCQNVCYIIEVFFIGISQLMAKTDSGFCHKYASNRIFPRKISIKQLSFALLYIQSLQTPAEFH